MTNSVSQISTQVYSDLQQWQQEQTIKATIGEETESVFNYMENQPKTAEALESQILSLAYGELVDKDSNKDNSINLKEYIKAEIQSLGYVDAQTGREASEEEIMDTVYFSGVLFDALDGLDGSEKDDAVKLSELAQFYINADMFDNGEMTDVLDGKISADYALYLMISEMDKLKETEN